MSIALTPTQADQEIKECLLNAQSFSVIAGAGSGKTTSLITALNFLRTEYGEHLRRDGQKVVCITYTKRATAVINERLGFDDLYVVSTIHSFLWGAVSRFTKDIKGALRDYLIPMQIEKQRGKDNGGGSKTALRARERVAELEAEIELLEQVPFFKYDESQFSSFSKGLIGHDDVINLASFLLKEKPLLQRGIGFQYPYIFIDEAQDTFDNVIAAFNQVCAQDGLPIVGYFGDPMQKIYDNGTGEFNGPDGFRSIDKEENFRSAPQIVTLTNKLRSDIQQQPAGRNSTVEGSVVVTLIQSEPPAAARGKYEPEQLDRALDKFDRALVSIGWEDNTEAKRLFLVRQMIARRLGFTTLQNLFTGTYASTKASDQYLEGSHFLLKPFVKSLCPLLVAQRNGDSKELVNILREKTPAFDINGENKNRPLREMLNNANELISELVEIWDSGSIKEVLTFAQNNSLCVISDRLSEHLARERRSEEFDSTIHNEEKSDWLADIFFTMPTNELLEYYLFVSDHTPLSTQHGSKGEEYDDVLVVFDDIEAAWTMYSFTKLFTPMAAGEGTEGQLNRSRKLAYVCFSRACINLRIFLFCPNPTVAKDELIASELFLEEQIKILPEAT